MNYKVIGIFLITLLVAQSGEFIKGFNRQNNLNVMTNNITLDNTVNPDEYIVGPGDEFYFSMMTANGINNQRLVVSPIGDVIIPIIGKIKVDKMILSNVFSLITKECNKQNVNIDITLSRIKNFKVLVVGPNKIPGGYYPANSMTRLSDIFNFIYSEFSDSIVHNPSFPDLSSRNIIIESNNSSKLYDLLAYNYTGDKSNNPYIKQGDVIRVSYISEYINVYGAVKIPGKYEYKEDEKIKTLIELCGGYEPNVDLNTIEVTRYISDFSKELLYIAEKDFDSFIIMPNDEILIKPKKDFKRKNHVTISGEIVNPGIYTIDSNEVTTIKDMILRGGGYSSRADSSKIVLNNKKIDELGDQELNRILALSPEDRSNADQSYLRARARSKKGGFSNSDFNIENSTIANYEVFDKDVIHIPTKYDFIEVIGAVRNPGRYPYQSNQNFKDYIYLSGGMTKNATKKYYVIEASTGDRIHLKAPFKYTLKSQDIIFIEEKNEYRFWDKFRDIIELTSQLLTIIAVTLTITTP